MYGSTPSLTSALYGNGWSTLSHATGALSPRVTRYPIGGWMGLGVGSTGAENLAPTGIRPPNRPACSYPRPLPDIDTVTISATNDCVLTCSIKTRWRRIGVTHDAYFRNDQLILANLNEALRHSALLLFEIGIVFRSGVAWASFLLGSDTTSTIVGLPTEVAPCSIRTETPQVVFITNNNYLSSNRR
jgi:hypothetical protein